MFIVNNLSEINNKMLLQIEKTKLRFEKQTKKDVKRILLNEYLEFVSLVEKYKNIDIAFTIYELNYRDSDLFNVLKKHIAEAYTFSYNKIKEQILSIKQLEDITLEELIRQYIQEQAAERIKNIDSTTLQQIKKAIEFLTLEEYSIIESIKYLRQHFALESDYRAERIARTEINASLNAASFEYAKFKNTDVKKVWLSARDNRVRGTNAKDKSSHLLMNRQEREINEAFQDPRSSAKLRYPGDTLLGAGASDVVMCRCTLIYKTKD